MNMLESIFAAVVDASWRGAWLIAAVLLLQWAFRRHVSARVVRWLSLALVLRLLVPFAIPGGWSPFPAHLFGSPASQAPSAPVAVEVPTVLPETAAMTPSAAVAPSARRSPLSPLPAAAMVWALGAAVLIVSRLLAAMTFAGRLRRSSRPAPAAVLAEAQRQFGSDRIRAFVTDRITAPALYGVLRPRLLFPLGLIERLGSAELRLIIAHERGHHLRRDLLMQELARFAAAVHWFNPLAWVAAARLRYACELACDEFVLSGAARDDRAEYGAALLRVLSLTNGTRTPRFAFGVVESKQQLKRRIQMIAHPSAAAPLRTLLVCTVGFTAVVVTLTRPSRAAGPMRVLAAPNSTPTVAAAPTGIAEDNLERLFPNGVVATVGGKTITVAQVRREIAPLLPQFQRETKNLEELRQRIGVTENSIIKDLVERELLLQEFHTRGQNDPARHIAAESVEQAIDQRIQREFGGDRDKFMASLRARGMTMDDYRRQVEEDIIYSYMRSKERKLTGYHPVTPPDHKGAVHLRLIELARNGESDAALLKRADEVLARFHQGESFPELAEHLSVDARHIRGGDWGWVRESDVKPQYWSSIRDLPKHEVSAPILLPEGCFLLYVEDRG